MFSLRNQGAIKLAESLGIGGNVSIVGPGARRLRIMINETEPQLPEPFPLFYIYGSGTNAVIRGLTLTRGVGLESLGQSVAGAMNIAAGVSLFVAECSIVDNSSVGRGGAIQNRGLLTVTRSLFAQNRADDEGGAIRTFPGSTTRIMNSTFSGNKARYGGGIYAEGTVVSVNNTFALGQSFASNPEDLSEGRDIYGAAGAQVSLMNTLVVSDNGHFVPSLFGGFMSLGNNVITDARDSTGFSHGVNGDQVSSSNAINPLIGPLADNGGQTDTHALLTGSPAINAGNTCVFLGPCPTVPGAPVRLFWDQRVGFLRQSIGSTPDIGSYESGNTTASGSVSFGSINPLPGPRPFLNNSQVIVFEAETGTRTYSSIGPATTIRYGSGPAPVTRVVEFRSKRAAMQIPPFVLAVPD